MFSISFYQHLINSSLKRISFQLSRNNNGKFIAQSNSYPEISTSGKTIDETLDKLQDALRTHPQFLCNILR